MSVDYQYLLFQTNDTELEILKKNYNISDKMLDESIERLKDWYKLQRHLPQIDIEQRFLERIIATNGFSVEKAKTKLDNLFLCRSQLTEYFDNRFPLEDNITKTFKAVNFAVMPQMTEDHCRVSIMRIRDVDPNLFDPTEMFRLIYVICDLETWFDTMVGLHIVWDCTHTKFGHVVKITPVMLKKFFYVFLKCYGAKLKSIHILNAPSYANSLINAGKMMLKKKIADRVYSHQSLEDLYKHLPSKYLPKELGGLQKSYDEITGQLIDAIKSKDISKVLEYMDRLKSDESKRVNSVGKSMDDILGITGTFRKLDVD